jgi:serine/threonine-protein kinase
VLLGGALVAVLVAVGVGLWMLRPGSEPPAPGVGPAHARSAIAVLPFDNLSAEGPHAFFARGLHDELLTQLAKVAALKVISRTSVMGYQSTPKQLKTIASELGVGSVVEGSVQVVGERLRVNVQLIDATTDEHLWAESYDRTLNDAFAIQSEVAQAIVVAVGATLTSTEQRAVTATPTANAEAYQLYLQGRVYETRPGVLESNLEIAQQFYERALALDPKFALAHAALSVVHGRTYFLRYDPSPSRTAAARAEAMEALRLEPDLPRAHFAMGMSHYQGRREYQQALDEFAIAIKGLPNDAELWQLTGVVNRRLGNWDRVIPAFERAVQLDPRRADLFTVLPGRTYTFMRRYPEAVRAFEQALKPRTRPASCGARERVDLRPLAGAARLAPGGAGPCTAGRGARNHGECSGPACGAPALGARPRGVAGDASDGARRCFRRDLVFAAQLPVRRVGAATPR